MPFFKCAYLVFHLIFFFGGGLLFLTNGTPFPRLCSSSLFDAISQTNNALSLSSDQTLGLSESGQWAGPQRGGGSSAPFLSVYVSLGLLLSALVSFCHFVLVSICVSHFLFVSFCFSLLLIVLVDFCPFLHVSVRFCQLM